jgi:hypothetical protein
MSNTIGDGVYREEWEIKLQERLAYETNWKMVCDVVMTNSKRVNIPYMATTPAAASLARDTYFTWSDNALTNEYIDIATPFKVATTIDLADLAQCSYEQQMTYADIFGQELNEQVEYAFLGDYANLADFDNGVVTANATDSVNITVGTDNIDDIVGAMKREITEANGDVLADRNGTFIIWRAPDFEKLESWARSNGYNTADDILINGIKVGMRYLGVEHYRSNKHTAGHIVGGVKKLYKIGILNTTYGKVDIVPFPVTTGNLYSVGIASRIDYGLKAPYNFKSTLLFDIQVN